MKLQLFYTLGQIPFFIEICQIKAQRRRMKITFNATLLRYAAESQHRRHLAYIGLKLSGSLINIVFQSEDFASKMSKRQFPLFIQITKIKQKNSIITIKKVAP